MTSPVAFLDHMGPASFPPGEGINVRPHPHINLATVTYLFEGEIEHRDSVGSHQLIHPGAINWMTAGRGIAHSERTRPALRAIHSRLHGLQLWVALPRADEETEPAFSHYPKEALPEFESQGARVRVLIGSAFGVSSPVKTFSPTFFVDAGLQAGAQLTIGSEYAERGLYVVSGRVTCGPTELAPQTLATIQSGATLTLHSHEPSRVVLLGGAKLDGPRHMWWNFVSSRAERIEQAKADWKDGRFKLVSGDSSELIPLPEQ